MHNNFDSRYLQEKYPRKFTGFSIGVRTIITTSVFFNDEIYLSIKKSPRNIATGCQVVIFLIFFHFFSTVSFFKIFFHKNYKKITKKVNKR